MDKGRVGIIGGGAAGLFAGCFLRKKGVEFTILERGSQVGRKLLLTGHGRCNITNRKQAKDLKVGYYDAGNFLYPSIKGFDSESAIDFIQNELHVPLKEEENGRMFPVSDKASDVLDALVNYAGEDNVITDCHCVSIDKADSGYVVTSDDGSEYEFDAVILACGGKSYPKTGSDGTSYVLASKFGHNVTPLIPALTAVDVRESDREFTAALRGVSVNAGASLYYDNKKHTNETGDILFTHRGLSGPAIQKISREIPRDIEERDGWIEIDFTPGRTDTEVDAELLEQMRAHTDTKLTNLVSNYVPQSVANQLGIRAGVTDIYAGRATKEERRAYVKELKHLELHIDNPPSYEEAYVTRGGISLKEVRRENLESKLSEGLYIIGEMLDVDGISGGYNLQACISEAWAVATNLAE